MFDLIFLRIFPTIIFISIYYYILLFPSFSNYFFHSILIIFYYLIISIIIFSISLFFNDKSISILISGLLLLYNLLFSGLILLPKSLPSSFQFLFQSNVFFNCFEGIMFLEMKEINFKLNQIGGGLEVNGIAVFDIFGFDDGGFKKNLGNLIGMFFGLLIVCYIILKFKVKEKR